MKVCVSVMDAIGNTPPVRIPSAMPLENSFCCLQVVAGFGRQEAADTAEGERRTGFALAATVRTASVPSSSGLRHERRE